MPSYQPLRLISVDQQDDGILIIHVTVPQMLDEQAEELRREFASVIHEARPHGVVADLSHVMMISSSGVGVMLSLLRRVREHNGKLVLCGMAPVVEEVFELCRLTSPDGNEGVFITARDVDSAVAVLK